MGCGTGPLHLPEESYEVTLTFDGGRISKTDPIYSNFKSALDWLLVGLRAVGASGQSTEHITGQNVTSITVEVYGPLLSPHTEKFNRAFNRLLWGVQHTRSLAHPPRSGASGSESPQFLSQWPHCDAVRYSVPR